VPGARERGVAARGAHGPPGQATAGAGARGRGVAGRGRAAGRGPRRGGPPTERGAARRCCRGARRGHRGAHDGATGGAHGGRKGRGGEEREGEGRGGGAHLGVQIRRSPSPKPRAPRGGGRERLLRGRNQMRERDQGALGTRGPSWAGPHREPKPRGTHNHRSEINPRSKIRNGTKQHTRLSTKSDKEI
jgi:hypothetical protein